MVLSRPRHVLVADPLRFVKTVLHVSPFEPSRLGSSGPLGGKVSLAQLRLIGREVLFDGDRRGRGKVGSSLRIGAATTVAPAFPSLLLLGFLSVCLSVCLPVSVFDCCDDGRLQSGGECADEFPVVAGAPSWDR